MLKEIAEQPQGGGRHAARPGRRERPARLDEMRLTDDELREIDKIIIVACGTAYHAGLLAKYAIEHWTQHPLRGRAGQRVPLPRPDPDPVHAGHRDLPVRRDDGHADGRPARPRAAGPGAGDLQRERLDDPARVRRGASTRTPARRSRSPRPRRSSPSWSPATWSRCTWPRCAASCTARRSARSWPSCSRCPPRSTRCSTRWSRSARLARELAGERCVLFLGRHVGFPVALEGALKLKELAYMHAEGFAAGELKHGPIALIEQGLPVVVAGPVPARPPRAARQDRLQHPGDPRPRGPDDRHRRGGRRRGGALRRHADRGAGRARRCCSRWSPPCRCRCSRASWPRPRATTSTSPATWPSPSPSSNARRPAPLPTAPVLVRRHWFVHQRWFVTTVCSLRANTEGSAAAGEADRPMMAGVPVTREGSGRGAVRARGRGCPGGRAGADGAVCRTAR